MMGRVARDAIFLAQFKAEQLPYADIAAAVLAGGIMAVYIRAARVRSLRALQGSSLFVIAVSLVLFWWGLHFEHWTTWLAPGLYVWVGICGALAVAQVWTLANFVWTTREAKRLFGMLGSGGIVGGIVGGFLARWTARTFGTDALLLMMAAALLPCLFLISLVWRHRPSGGAPTVQPDAPEPADNAEAPQGLLASARLAGNSPHLRTIAILICLAAMTTTAVSWELKAIAKSTLVTKDAMAAYLGAFTGYTGLLSLLVQLLVTTKLLRRFGVGVALLVLPTFLMVGSVAVAIWGTLWAATLLKGSDAVVRYSIDSSSVQLLYLPVPGGIKLQMKSFIDTVIWKLGDGLAGLTLLLFATTLRFTPREIAGVTLVLLTGWMAAAIVARRQYVATLRSNIQHIGGAADAGSVLSVDKFTTNVFAEKLSSSDPEEVLGALKLFEVGQRIQTHGGIRSLLAHPSADVRRKAVSVLNAADDTSVRDEVRALLNDEDMEVRTEALRYLTRHDRADPLEHIESLQGFRDTAIRSATIAALARPGDGQNIDAASFLLERMVGEEGEAGIGARLEAAWLIGTLPDRFEDQLAILIADSDPEVRREAIRSAGALRKVAFAPMLITQLDHPSVGPDAAAALVLFGDDVVETLRDSLDSSQVPPRCRQVIPLVLMRIGSPAAAVALANSLLQTDLELRFRVISALNKLHEVRRDLTVDRPVIESTMIAELMGHYRSYQLLGALGGEAEAELKASMVAEMERIFRLLKLLFPSIDLHNAYLGVQSRDPVTHANALEFLDNTLTPRLRALLVPLVDSDVSVEERIRQADRFLGFTASGAPVDRR